ncbi:MAG TPA: ATP synthase F0 subunit B [Elusimicrobia bacterium]|nr:ATP synthase F0 subunit B [Elusimicrobiota bacterium]
MDKLLNPDPGIYLWTVLSFLILVGLLKAFAWGPLLKAVEDREESVRRDREGAEAAKRESERIQQELEGKLAGLDAQARELLAQAGREAEALREKLKQAAEDESRRLLEKTREQLAEEKARLVVELRREVADLSVQVAERLLKRSVDPALKKKALDEFLDEVDPRGGRA